MPFSASLVVAAQEMRLRQKHEISRTSKIFFIYSSIPKLKFYGLVLSRYFPDFPKRGTTQKVKAVKMFCPGFMGLIAGKMELKI